MKQKIIKWGLIVAAASLVIAGGTALYLLNMPHRDVQATSADYQISAAQLVQEYLDDSKKSNDKYLQEEGESKVLAVSGTIASINEDMNHQKVLLLREAESKAGVSCTFTTETNSNVEKLKIGQKVLIKGVIRSGAGYDQDLEMYEDVILEKCDILTR
jgi:hypothetical protein